MSAVRPIEAVAVDFAAEKIPVPNPEVLTAPPVS